MATYADGTLVELGDRVCVRSWFKDRLGTVVYLPGVSSLNPSMEYGGLSWVGIRLDGGGFVGSLVFPESGRLKKRVRLVARGTGPVEPLAVGEDPFAR